MIPVKRFLGNPILAPRSDHPWEHEAAFNGCIIQEHETLYHFVYRAQSSLQNIQDKTLELSTIGYAKSLDRVHFDERRLLITPEFEWEQFGCEDPRVTKIDGTYYITYTALADFPPKPEGIQIAVATTKDFRTIEEKHLVTHFNSKAMGIFPEKIGDSYAAILAVNTDEPPAKIAIATFPQMRDLWNRSFWESWYKELDTHGISLQYPSKDHIEVGAQPLKTEKGWLLIYCYIRNYQTSYKSFGIEALLLDLHDPQTVIGKTDIPLLTPETDYELIGKVPNVIFPSGALLFNKTLGIYYGAADTTCCVASCDLDELLSVLSENAS